MKRNHIKQRIRNHKHSKWKSERKLFSGENGCVSIHYNKSNGWACQSKRYSDTTCTCTYSINRHVAGQQPYGLGALILGKCSGDFSCFQFHHRTAIVSNKCLQSCYMQSAIFLFLLTNS